MTAAAAAADLTPQEERHHALLY
jgi:hypothetical protein